ncbi:MAG: gamma-glutamyltransferase family protein [Pseudomonadota bacterium]
MRDFHSPGRSTLYARNGICATSHPLGAEVAVQMLRDGGNAVDAAIAGAVVLGLAEPAMTGIGGDMFALVKPAGTEEIIGLNASGRAPGAADAAALRARGWTKIDENSTDAVVVPGAIAGFAILSEDYGLKGLDACLAPAIHYADEGVPVAPRAAFDWKLAEPRLQGSARTHFLRNGKAPEAGDLFHAPGQAEALRRVSASGPQAFYEGEVAEDMIAALQAGGTTFSAEDFAGCRADYVTPVRTNYRDLEVVELPPNSHGVTALMMLRILERYDLSSLDPFGTERAHLEIEAAKLAYASRDRAISDPDYMTTTVEEFLDKAVIAELAERIDPTRAMAPFAAPLGSPHRDTIYITVVDRDRMVVSLIYSVFHSFGVGRASERFGINFNNRGAGFTLAEGHPNELGPRKRPLHTIIPGLVRQGGRVAMSFGVMGGAYQPHGHARLVTNIHDFGMDVQAAIDGPRLDQEAGEVRIERGYAPEVWEGLRARGHVCVGREVPIGGAQAIMLDPIRDVLIAGSDPRKDGIALGY